eukprot:m.178395 g.178395  ORF g.178395 m.178395 type:complete len:55 (+) comp14639_c0_seq24:3489-3653(+)
MRMCVYLPDTMGAAVSGMANKDVDLRRSAGDERLEKDRALDCRLEVPGCTKRNT